MKTLYDLLKQQEEKYPVDITFNDWQIRDSKHLESIWYGGEIARIKYKGYTVTIEARGDVEVCGKIKGRKVDFCDKHNQAAAWAEIGSFVNDEDLEKEEVKSAIIDSNWFEFNVIEPSGKYLEYYGNNVLDGNLIDCLEDIGDYLDIVNNIIDDIWRDIFLNYSNDEYTSVVIDEYLDAKIASVYYLVTKDHEIYNGYSWLNVFEKTGLFSAFKDTINADEDYYESLSENEKNAIRLALWEE